MRRRRDTIGIIAAAILLGTHLPAHGQAPIASSRLGLTKAPAVLSARVFQLEAGYTHAAVDERTRQVLGETLLRIGVGRRSEIRAGLPSLIRTASPSDTVSGFADAFVAARHRFSDASGLRPTFTLQAGTTLPVGEHGIGAGELQPEAAGYALWRIPAGFQLLTMAVHRNAIAAGDRFGISTGSAGVRRDLAPGVTAQVDYGVTHSTRAGGSDVQQARVGAAVRIGPELQLDGWTARATVPGGHEYQFGLGFARRW
jgi:hypothetical protein